MRLADLVSFPGSAGSHATDDELREFLERLKGYIDQEDVSDRGGDAVRVMGSIATCETALSQGGTADVAQCFLRLGFHLSAYNRDAISRDVRVRNIRTKGKEKRQQRAAAREKRDEKIRAEFVRLTADGNMTSAQSFRRLGHSQEPRLRPDTVRRIVRR